MTEATFIQVITTTAQREDAEKIAEVLVEKRLAACVQIIGLVRSIYRWQGNIERVEEWQCLIKSRHELYGDIEATIKEIHPYETPEIIALPVIAGCRDYLDWLGEELKKAC